MHLKSLELQMYDDGIKSYPESTLFLIRDDTDVKIVVCKTSSESFIIDASPVDRSLIGTIVSELGTNIIKYAGKGSIKLSRFDDKENTDIHIWAEDKGPGIPNLEMAMEEHFSTGNTLGLGLSGVKRIANIFNIQSNSKQGTVVFASKRIKGNNLDSVSSFNDQWLTKYAMGRRPLIDVGFFNLPKSGYKNSGDLVTLVEFDSYILFSVVDVSGHGDKAHDLSNIIANFLHDSANADLNLMISQLHKLLIGTLGAAIGLLLFNTITKEFEYIGVGNTGVNRCLGGAWTGISRDGILGDRLPSFHEKKGVLNNGDVFAMWSDGVSGHLVNRFVKSNQSDSAKTIATNMIKELAKSHDDASCIIIKWLG